MWGSGGFASLWNISLIELITIDIESSGVTWFRIRGGYSVGEGIGSFHYAVVKASYHHSHYKFTH
jgi:hypothetical protein